MCRVSGGQNPNLDELLWSLFFFFFSSSPFNFASGGFLAGPPLITNCLHLPFGTQGRSSRQESCLQETGAKKASVPRSPTGSSSVSFPGCKDEM